MKAFLEEYGITVVVSVVITALIGVGVVFADTGGNTLKGFVNNFQNEAQLASVESTPTKPVPTITVTDITHGGEFFENHKCLIINTNSDGAISASINVNFLYVSVVNKNNIEIANAASSPGTAILTISVAETENYAANTITYEIAYPKAGNAPI